ncbi:MAG: hypothetical protein J1E41_04380 [Ruminococcus sp.]|nr:hypothetical protein [Ruminococcus sp.]
MKQNEPQKIRKHRILYSLLGVILAIAIIAVSVYAAYLRETETVKNTFSPVVSVLPEVREDFDKNVKKDVKIHVGEPEEVGKTEYPVYVRANLVFNWREEGKENGAVYFSTPVLNEDYTLTINDAKWQLKKDGYYYYSDPVMLGDVTDVLITECKPIKSAPKGYALSVTIITQTVQAVGHTDDDSKTAAEDAWNMALKQA